MCLEELVLAKEPLFWVALNPHSAAGMDSIMWRNINCLGRTVFLEGTQCETRGPTCSAPMPACSLLGEVWCLAVAPTSSPSSLLALWIVATPPCCPPTPPFPIPAWIDKVRAMDPQLEIYHVTYNTTVGTSPVFYTLGPWALDVPDSVKNDCYDVILVDAPQGFNEKMPGGAVLVERGGGPESVWLGGGLAGAGTPVLNNIYLYILYCICNFKCPDATEEPPQRSQMPPHPVVHS